MLGIHPRIPIKRRRLLIELFAVIWLVTAFRKIKQHSTRAHYRKSSDTGPRFVNHRSINIPSNHHTPIRIYTDTTGAGVACMVRDACFSTWRGNQQILQVPVSLRSHEKLLRTCIRPNQRFHYYEAGEMVGSEVVHIDHVDVLGMPFVDPFYKHFAHLGPKIIAFALLPASLFLSKNPRVKCVSPIGEVHNCDVRNEWPSRPRFVVGEGVIHNKKGEWNRDFTRMLSGNLSNLHIHTFKNDGKLPTMCFRSAITSPLNYDGSLELHDRILREKGVERALNLVRDGDVCKPRVVVLLRDPGRKAFRTFPDNTRTQLAETLDEHLKRSKLQADIEIIVDLGKGRSQQDQMAVFQRADVLASAHGAELTNALFLRNDARIIELSPFGLYDGWFHNTIRAANAHETKICAPPDRKLFRACVKDGIVKRGGDKSRLEQSPAMKEFDTLARDYQWLAPDTKCKLKNDESRRCVRQQRMLIDAHQLSSLILTEVRALCAA